MANSPLAIASIKTGAQLARSYLYGICKNLQKAKDAYATKLLHTLTGDQRLTQFPDISYCVVEVDKTSSSNNTFNWSINNGCIRVTASSDVVSQICTSLYTEEFSNLSTGSSVTLSKTPTCVFLVVRNGLQQATSQYTLVTNVITFTETFDNNEDVRVVYLSKT